MAVALAATVLFAVTAAVLSVFGYLPAMAVAESISPRRASARAAVWFCALILPVLGGAGATAFGMRSALFDRYGSPHLGGPRIHLCSRWLVTVPDASWHLTVVGSFCVALITAGAVRLVLSAARSAWIAGRLRERATPSGLVVADSPAPLVATIGFLRPVTVVSTGAMDALSSEELAAGLAHEEAHARRHDNVADLIAGFCQMCLVFVPTVHLYLRYWREEAERACDDAAAKRWSGTTVAGAMVELAVADEARARHRILPAEGLRWRHAVHDVRARASRLVAAEQEMSQESGDVETLGHTPARTGAGVGQAVLLAATVAGLLTLGLVATRAQIGDSVRCLADTLLEILSR